MSKNLKCPVCEVGAMIWKERGRLLCECSRCRFQCQEDHLEKITAAMEYTKKTAYWFGLPGGVDHQEDARAEQAMQDAEKRALEVFNA